MAAIAPIASGAISQIGALASPFVGAQQLLGTVESLTGRNAADQQQREQELALKQLKQQQKLQKKQLEADAALDRERIAADAEAAERERRAALRRAVARQQAQFGSSGVSSTGGSAQAVLLGLFEESEDELAERERLDSLRGRAIDLSLSGRQSLNVLQRTQLQERQRFQNELLDDEFLF